MKAFLGKITAIECISLILRLLLWAWVLASRHWVAGDSLGFMSHAVQLCSGHFLNGESGDKSPLYSALACMFSLPVRPLAGPLFWMSRAFGGVLLAQSLFQWGAGVWVRRRFGLQKNRCGKVWQCIYHFDPVLFVYSGLLMSDAFFASFVLIAAVLALEWFAGKNRKGWQGAAWLGFWCGLILLERSVGLVWVGWLAVCLLLSLWNARSADAWKKLAAWTLVLFALVMPRLFFQWHWGHMLALNDQGPGWLASVAAAVEGDSRGVSFKQAEDEWNQMRLRPSPLYVFAKHPLTLAKLTLKGVARTMVGHVNVEWGLVTTGKTLFGPAWFKHQERRQGSDSSSALYVVQSGWLGQAAWVAGVVLAALWSLWVYFTVLVQMRATGWMQRLPLIWVSGTVVLMCTLPLIFGDARFRLGYLPVILVGLANAVTT